MLSPADVMSGASKAHTAYPFMQAKHEAAMGCQLTAPSYKQVEQQALSS